MENKTSNIITVNPFKGPSSYSEQDTLYGRKKELNELIGIIVQNTLSLLFSKSGVGKTSLIKAGVIPVLKARPDFFPVYIRITEIRSGSSFSQLAIEQILVACAEYGNIKIKHLADKLPAEQTLAAFLFFSEFIRTYEDEKGEIKECATVPVLIFDQSEVLFTGKISDKEKDAEPQQQIIQFNKKVTAFLDDLKSIIEGRLPDSLNDFLSTKPDLLATIDNNLQYNSKWYRILFAFREEYLHRFESLKHHIAAFGKTNGRLHLESFAEEKAAEVIEEISEQSIKVKHNIAKKLAAVLSTTDQDLAKVKQQVPPFMLSLVCHSIYPKLIANPVDTALMKALDEKDASFVNTVIHDYAAEVFGKVSLKTKTFVEEDLITEKGSRTMSAVNDIADMQIISETESLCDDPNMRYLNKVDYFGEPHVEILHDRLVQPCLNSRTERRKEERKNEMSLLQKKKRKIIKRAVVISGLVALLAAFFVTKEKTENNKYVSFFSQQDKVQLTQLKKEVKENSVSSLVKIFNYKEITNNLPHVKGFFCFLKSKESVSEELQEFRDSVTKIFDSLPLLYKYDVPTVKKYFNQTAIFRFRDSIASTDTIYTNIEKLTDTGFIQYGYISVKAKATSLYGQQQRNRDSVLDKKYGREKNIRTYIQSDSLVYVIAGESLNIYNLYNKSVKNALLPWQTINIRKLKFRFSADGKYIYTTPLHFILPEARSQKPEIISIIEIATGRLIKSAEIPFNYSKFIMPAEFQNYYEDTSAVFKDYTAMNLVRDNENSFQYYKGDFYILTSAYKSDDPSSKYYNDKVFKLVAFPGHPSPIILPFDDLKASDVNFLNNKYIAGWAKNSFSIVNLNGEKASLKDSLSYTLYKMEVINNNRLLIIGTKGEMSIYKMPETGGNAFNSAVVSDTSAIDSLRVLYSFFLSADRSKIVRLFSGYLDNVRIYHAEITDLDNFKKIAAARFYERFYNGIFMADSTLLLSAYSSGADTKWFYNVPPPYKFETLQNFYYRKRKQVDVQMTDNVQADEEF